MESVFNFLPEFLLWGSALYFWIFTLLFISILFICEVKESGYNALVAFVIFSIVTRSFSNFDILSVVNLKLVLIYLGIGLVHAFIRTYFYGRKRGIEKKTKEWGQQDGREEYFNETTQRRLKGNVFRWWFLFPVSLLTWIFSDLLKDFYNFAYSKLRVLFVKILNLGQNSVKNE